MIFSPIILFIDLFLLVRHIVIMMHNIPRPESKQLMPDDARRVFKGLIFDVYHYDQIQYDGSIKTFERLKRPDNTIVFPVFDDGQILVSIQEQPGMKSFIGGFGGRVEDGEDPLQGAKRELLEEAGYTAREWILWKSLQPISKIEWAVYVFIAKGLEYTGHNSPDSGERIQTRKISFDDFLQLGRNPAFSEHEVKDDIYEALLDRDAYTMLKNRFCI